MRKGFKVVGLECRVGVIVSTLVFGVKVSGLGSQAKARG